MPKAKESVKNAVARPAKKKTALIAARSVPKGTARPATEIMAPFTDSAGLAAKVAAALAAENVNILAGTGYSASGPRQKALDMIGADEVQDSSVNLVEMEDKVGSLEGIAKLISDAGIMIYPYYATTSTGKMASCVIRTADDRKAIKVLQKG